MDGRKVEILAPAGSAESLKAAVCAGADAVYIGGTKFGARAYAKNLTEDELLEAIDYVHIHGRRIYLTVNTLLKDSEIEGLYEYLLPYYLRGLDGVIVQDVGVLQFLRMHLPGLPVHASTQMTVTGADGAAFLQERGVVRVVPARELSLREIRRMKEQTGMEIECFVHGALCYCYSGQCLLSSMIGGRSGNRGQCAQPCRLPWQTEGRKTGDLMSLKDLCTIDLLPDFIDAGIDSFKIEGRMKQPDYVYTVTEIYRKYVDVYLEKGPEYYKVEKDDRDRLYAAYQRRGYTDGYYRRHNGKDMISFQRMQGEKEDTGGKEFKIQEKINGNLILSVGERAKLVLVHGNRRVECEGETVQPALRQPLDAERAGKQMQKTGNTQFNFEQFQVEMEGDVFLPVQALNELRREGINRLTEAILNGYRREEPEGHGKESGGSNAGNPKLCLSCVVQSFDQLKAVVGSEEVERIYIDDELGLQDKTRQYLAKCRKGRQLFLVMPYIFRMADMAGYEAFYSEMESFYDGVLIRNWESYGWLLRHGYGKEICTDGNLYVFNRYGKTFMQRQGIRKYRAAAELNSRELKELDIRDAALSVYGYQPVMVTANCIQKTVGKCRKEGGYLSLCDRFQKQFSVRQCCRYCYNVMYNSAPLFLADKAKEVLELMPGELRLDFTVETGGQAREILQVYKDAFLRGQKIEPPRTEYTRGHFKRGVK
ncbi:U32 family peptidase [Lachnospiraceae bacterium 48-21]